MGCEESFITIKLIWHDYLISSLGICVHKTLVETGLSTRQEDKQSEVDRGGTAANRWHACVSVSAQSSATEHRKSARVKLSTDDGMVGL